MRVWGSEFTVQGSGLMVSELKFSVSFFRVRFYGLVFRNQGAGFKVQGLRFSVWGLGFMAWGWGVRV